MFVCKVRTRNCATKSWPGSPHGVAATIGAMMRPTPAELEVARALIARVKATDPSIKRVDELLVWATVACRAGELVGVPRPFALGRWARTSRGRSRCPTGSLGLRSSSKRLQRSPTAACSCSQLGSRRMCQTFAPPIRHQVAGPENTGLPLSGSPPTVLAADRGWGGANAHLEVEGRRIPGSSRWVLIDQYQGHCEHVLGSDIYCQQKGTIFPTASFLSRPPSF